MADGAKLKIAFHITKEEGQEKAFWNRIGKAFLNKNGSINLMLQYLPLPVVRKDGTVEPVVINIQDYKPKEDNGKESFSE